MEQLKHISTIVFCLLFVQNCFSQNFFIEGGAGVGNILGQENRRGKSEAHLTLIKPLDFGEIGVDFSTGGNFIPLNENLVENNIEVVSPNDTKFNSAVLLYRLPINKYFFVEPRLGYTSLSALVHTDDRTKIKQGNLTTGFGLGARLSDNVLVSLRYQFYGNTLEYEGFKSDSNTVVKSISEPISMILLRGTLRFGLGTE